MAERELSDEMKWLLQQPVTFDPLRDPNWKPSREDYQAIRDTLAGHLAATAEKLQQAEQRLQEVGNRATREFDRAQAAEQREKELRNAIEEYMLWEPGRAGHAAAHEMLRRAALAVPACTGATARGAAMSIGDYENATSRAWESIIRKIEDERDALQARLDAALDVIEAARLLTRRDTFDMRIVKVREDNLLDALAVFDGLARSGTNT